MEIIALPQLLRFIAALIFVLALMGGLALVMRRVNQGGVLPGPLKKRLGILEILPLDSRRKLVLLRRDDREHLVILGPHGETLVEGGIAGTAAGNSPTADNRATHNGPPPARPS